MRALSLAFAVSVIAAPAMASSPGPAQPTVERAVRALQDPMAQEVAAGVIDQLIGIVLDTRIGPVAALTDPRAAIRPTDTLHDLKRRDDHDFDRHLHNDTRRAVGTAAAVVGGAMAEGAELKHTADRLQAALAPLATALAAPDAHGRD